MATSPDLLAALAPIIGKWRTTGTMVDEAGRETMTIVGTDEYEWMLGEAWMIHHVDVLMGDERTRALELFGDFDEERDCLLARAFDASGRFDTMTLARLPDGAWRFTGDGIRSTLRPAPDRSAMAALWERQIDGGDWIPWMRLQFAPAGD